MSDETEGPVLEERLIDYKAITKDGLWSNNVVFAQMLALCPLLAVTGTATNGLGMGLATTAVMVTSGLLISALRSYIPADVRIPAFVLVIAALVTLVDMAMNAWVHELHKVLGLFIPLIVTNCAIIARAEAFASKNNVADSFMDGLFMGLGFTAVLVLLGAMREGLGFGTLFAQAHLMFGETAREWTITLIDNYRGYLLAILPPGAFLGLGFIIAAKNIIDKKQTKKSKSVNVVLNEATSTPS